jgi:hypothetical protein
MSAWIELPPNQAAEITHGWNKAKAEHYSSYFFNSLQAGRAKNPGRSSHIFFRPASVEAVAWP